LSPPPIAALTGPPAAKLGGKIGKAPVVLLTTVGRRSVKRRTTPLIYGEDNGDWIVIASNGGNEAHPGWWLNLKYSTAASIQVGKTYRSVVASEVEGPERERLWALMTAIYADYDKYQQGTARRIPVVRLRPVW
jgi:deazaflavin-dependent oxidoreductase (nitroreductase family)